MVKVRVWCYLDELEDEKKVMKALRNIFPTMSFVREGNLIKGKGKESDLNFLKELVWWKRILDTVRNFLISRKCGERTELLLHKQAAYSRKIGLVENDEESPFGAIHVEIEGRNLEDFIDRFFPKTKKGKPVIKTQ